MGHVRKLASCLGLLCPGHFNPAGQGPASHCTALSSGELHCLRYSSMHLTAATEQHQEWTVGCSLSSQGSTPPAAPLPCLWASWGSQVPPTHATDTSSLSTPFPSPAEEHGAAPIASRRAGERLCTAFTSPTSPPGRMHSQQPWAGPGREHTSSLKYQRKHRTKWYLTCRNYFLLTCSSPHPAPRKKCGWLTDFNNATEMS